jgi:hypothetical protein
MTGASELQPPYTNVKFSITSLVSAFAKECMVVGAGLPVADLKDLKSG